MQGPTVFTDNNNLTEVCRHFEHYETPRWAVDAILKRELLTHKVIDPCTGTGVLAEAAKATGNYSVYAFDIFDYGYSGLNKKLDWLQAHNDLEVCNLIKNGTVLMNPPFSKAVQFVEKAIELGAYKIVCFQRLSWYEAKCRQSFWNQNPPNRIYVCGERATCWRSDIPKSQRNSGSPTTHAWFVWQKGQRPCSILNHIWKADVSNLSI